MVADGGRVIIRSKPFIASELGGYGDPLRGLKITRARGCSSELRGLSVPDPLSIRAMLCVCLFYSVVFSRQHLLSVDCQEDRKQDC